MKRLFAVLFSFVFVFLVAVPAHAADFPDWTGVTPDISRGTAVTNVEGTDPTRPCAEQSIAIAGASTQACVTAMDGWRYASADRFVVSIGTDRDFYPVDGLPGENWWLHSGGGSALVVHDFASVWTGGTFAIYPNLPDYLRRDGAGYELDGRAPLTAHFADDSPVLGMAMGVSANGRWFAAETPAGIARVSTETGEARLISPVTVGRPASYGNMSLTLSDDGATTFVGGELYNGQQFDAIAYEEGCGSESAVISPAQACPTRDLQPLIGDAWAVRPSVSADGRRLNFVIRTFDRSASRASLYPHGQKPAAIRYLALGDSYSSGEGAGDYLGGTDVAGGRGVPTERCHVSPHAYPFLLDADRSVACSNATTGDIFAPDGYTGQDSRLAGLNPEQRGEWDDAALAAFIPGRVGQATFVDRYAPAAVSVTIGGNDLGFANIITSCVYSATTCAPAANPTDRRELGESIAAMYPKLTALYSRLAAESPGTKVYAVGYPRFINETKLYCPLTTGLDFAERTMIDDATRYFDQVIRAAALSAGVAYVDAGDALVGHRICDDDPGGVNAIALWGVDRAEIFHPSADGHAAIAASIRSALGTGDLADHGYCADSYPCPVPTDPPALPAFFTDGSSGLPYLPVPSELIAGNPVIEAYGVVVHALGLKAGSGARIELHSSPTALGSFTTNTDGNLTASLTLPDTVDPGFHTLHIYGESPSGEAVDLYQTVYVKDKQAAAGQQEQVATPVPDEVNKAGAGNDSVVTGAAGEEGTGGDACSKRCPAAGPIAILPETIGRDWPLLLTGELLAGGLAAGLVARRVLRRPN